MCVCLNFQKLYQKLFEPNMCVHCVCICILEVKLNAQNIIEKHTHSSQAEFETIFTYVKGRSKFLSSFHKMTPLWLEICIFSILKFIRVCLDLLIGLFCCLDHFDRLLKGWVTWVVVQIKFQKHYDSGGLMNLGYRAPCLFPSSICFSKIPQDIFFLDAADF